MTESDGLLTAWVLRDGAEAPGWVSTATPENPIDFEVANYFTSTHPRSPFVNGIMASASTPRGRVNLMNAEATFARPGGAEKRTLPDRKALRQVVAEHFGFDLPEIETMRAPAVPDWRDAP
jgi:N-hydroxyarylamine O-acetyltransferase